MSDSVVLAERLRTLERRLERIEAMEHAHDLYLLATGARAGATAQAQLFTRGIQAQWLDRPLVSVVDGSQFDDNTATYPTGWAEADAPLTTNTNRIAGFWFLYGQASNLWKYRRQVGGLTTGNNSFVVGPLLWRQVHFSSDLSYLFGMYRNNGGVIDEQSFVRTNLTYDSALRYWKIRGEVKDGTTQTNSAWVEFNQALAPMPLFLRLVIRSSATNLRSYVGGQPFADTHKLLQDVALTLTWGQPFLQFELAARPATGNDDYLYIGGHDRGSDA